MSSKVVLSKHYVINQMLIITQFCYWMCIRLLGKEKQHQFVEK